MSSGHTFVLHRSRYFSNKHKNRADYFFFFFWHGGFASPSDFLLAFTNAIKSLLITIGATQVGARRIHLGSCRPPDERHPAAEVFGGGEWGILI